MYWRQSAMIYKNLTRGVTQCLNTKWNKQIKCINYTKTSKQTNIIWRIINWIAVAVNCILSLFTYSISISDINGLNPKYPCVCIVTSWCYSKTVLHFISKWPYQELIGFRFYLYSFFLLLQMSVCIDLIGQHMQDPVLVIWHDCHWDPKPNSQVLIATKPSNNDKTPHQY